MLSLRLKCVECAVLYYSLNSLNSFVALQGCRKLQVLSFSVFMFIFCLMVKITLGSFCVNIHMYMPHIVTYCLCLNAGTEVASEGSEVHSGPAGRMPGKILKVKVEAGAKAPRLIYITTYLYHYLYTHTPLY